MGQTDRQTDVLTNPDVALCVQSFEAEAATVNVNVENSRHLRKQMT